MHKHKYGNIVLNVIRFTACQRAEDVRINLNVTVPKVIYGRQEGPVLKVSMQQAIETNVPSIEPI